MKHSWKIKILSMVLCGGLLFSGCSSNKTEPVQENEPLTGQTEQSQEAELPDEAPDSHETINYTDLRVAALKGPTGMGLVHLMEESETGRTGNGYTFTISGTADEISAGLIQGSIDIAAIPCNLASVLFNRLEGEVQMLGINTLGVLYVLEKGEEVQSIQDLQGRTLYTTGKGTTPEYSLAHILQSNGLDPDEDLMVEFRSEATELAALFQTDQIDLAMLPQPYVTTVLTGNPEIRVALDMNEEWERLNDGSSLVTGVAVIRKSVLEEHPEAVQAFMSDYAESVSYVNRQLEDAAALVEKFDIAPAKIAEQAIPQCNIVWITGEEMKTAAQGYLSVLFEANPASVGGEMPGDSFYYLP